MRTDLTRELGGNRAAATGAPRSDRSRARYVLQPFASEAASTVKVGGARSSLGAAAINAGRTSHGIAPWRARWKLAASRIGSGKIPDSGWMIHWDAPESACSQYSMFTRSGAFAE